MCCPRDWSASATTAGWPIADAVRNWFFVAGCWASLGSNPLKRISTQRTALQQTSQRANRRPPRNHVRYVSRAACYVSIPCSRCRGNRSIFIAVCARTNPRRSFIETHDHDLRNARSNPQYETREPRFTSLPMRALPNKPPHSRTHNGCNSSNPPAFLGRSLRFTFPSSAQRNPPTIVGRDSIPIANAPRRFSSSELYPACLRPQLNALNL